jgi:hypothetical protein
VTVAILVPPVFGWMYRRAYVQLRRRIADEVPVGSTYSAAADDERMWLGGPVGSAGHRYAAIAQVRTWGEFVFLKQRATSTWIACPVQVFPGRALDELRERVAAASAPANHPRLH